MARNKQASRRTVQATADGYENFVARVGMQTPNQHSASTYRANFTSRNRMLVEWSYRSSWLIGEAVDAILDDMTRKGIRITSEIDAKDRGTLEAQLDQLQIWDALNDVLKWSRLYGGAVGFIMIEGHRSLSTTGYMIYRMRSVSSGRSRRRRKSAVSAPAPRSCVQMMVLRLWKWPQGITLRLKLPAC